MGNLNDPYEGDAYQWWHLSQVSPELLAAQDDGWLGLPGRVLDVGCGLGVELAYLACEGWRTCGVDLSAVALQRARTAHPGVSFLQSDATRLPFADQSFDLVLDRGCFHYLEPEVRHAYAAEAARVLRPGGRMLLRVCLNSAGVRNDVTEADITNAFATWPLISLARVMIPSDTRKMPALEARLGRATLS